MRTLDRLITIQRKTTTRDSYGQDIETWTDLEARRPASVVPLSGDERFASQQFIARQQLEFRIRYSQNVSGLSPLDRIVYPPYTPTDSPPEDPPESRIFDIMAVHDLGRNEGLRILAVRRSEVRDA